MIRLIDAGRVSGLRSQALYHGLARAGGPDTIVLARPAERYVCIGLHQDLAHELDLAACRAQGLRVLRREVGGGAVLIEPEQLFIQWVMSPESLPLRAESRFARFAAPLVGCLQKLGLDARFCAPNDIHVGGRKITGTGAGRIGDREVIVGNVLLDFDRTLFARILRLESDALRAEVEQSLDEGLTTLRRELACPPDMEQLCELYREQLGRVELGTLNESEEGVVQAAQSKLSSTAFLQQDGGLRRAGIKIQQAVWVRQADTPAGPLVARLRDGKVEQASLPGLEGLGWDEAINKLEISDV